MVKVNKNAEFTIKGAGFFTTHPTTLCQMEGKAGCYRMTYPELKNPFLMSLYLVRNLHILE
jgi:hypothetical protein